MYIWVVLTTFLAIIAAYILPVRPDTEEMVTVPVAQARIMQMLVRQQAGIQYLKERAWPYFSNRIDKDVNYMSGELDVAAYLPHGFVNNNEYVTALYCMNEEMTTINAGSTAGCKKSYEQKVVRLLMTHGAIPEKWQVISDVVSNADGSVTDFGVVPSAEMIQALRNHFGTYEMVGYVVEDGGKFYIVNYEGTRFDVPDVVVDSTVVDWSLKACMEEYKTCLAYMTWR